MDPEELSSGVQTQTDTLMFTATLVTGAEMTNVHQLTVRPHGGLLLSHEKNEEALTPAVMWMNPETTMLSEKPDTKGHVLCNPRFK